MKRDLFDEDFEKACAHLRAGAQREKGIHLSKEECQILAMKLQTSVDIGPLVTMLHELIGKTLAAWKENHDHE